MRQETQALTTLKRTPPPAKVMLGRSSCVHTAVKDGSCMSGASNDALRVAHEHHQRAQADRQILTSGAQRSCQQAQWYGHLASVVPYRQVTTLSGAYHRLPRRVLFEKSKW